MSRKFQSFFNGGKVKHVMSCGISTAKEALYGARQITVDYKLYMAHFTNFNLSQTTSFNINLLEMLIQMKIEQLFSRQSSFSSQQGIANRPFYRCLLGDLAFE